MRSRDTRREENQKLFRLGNSRLHDLVESKVPGKATAVPFLCECAAADCEASVKVSIAQWEAVAAEPNHYVMVAGHERSEGEEVIGTLGEYDIVEKPD